MPPHEDAGRGAVPPVSIIRTAARILARAALLALVFPPTVVRAADRTSPAADTGAADQPASHDELLNRRRELQEEIAYSEARLALSRSKTYYLALDAPAHTVTLEMNGIAIRTCPIERLELDRRMIERRAAPRFVDSLAVPFTLLTRTGTIPETPLPVDLDTTKTKEAEEARQRAKHSDADLTFAFDRDLVVHITTAADSAELQAGPMRTRVMNRVRLLRLMVRSWLHGGPFRKEGEIFMQIGRSDARALYWALPDSSGLALRL